MIEVTHDGLREILQTVYGHGDRSTVLAVEGESAVGKTMSLINHGLPGFAPSRIIPVPFYNSEDAFLPHDDPDSPYTSFKIADTFRPDPDSRPFFIILDELNRCNNPTVFNTLMSMVNERKIGGCNVPATAIFVATLNPSTPEYPDTANIFADLASVRRFNRVGLRFDAGVFLRYAEETGMNHRIIQFLTKNPEQALVRTELTSPRMWQRLSGVLNSLDDMPSDRDMRVLSSLYMDNGTLNLWSKFLKDELDRFVTAKEIFDGPVKAKKGWALLQKHIDEDQLANLEATSRALETAISTAPDSTTIRLEQWEHLEAYLLALNPAQGNALISKLIKAPGAKNWPAYEGLSRMLRTSSAIMELLSRSSS